MNRLLLFLFLLLPAWGQFKVYFDPLTGKVSAAPAFQISGATNPPTCTPGLAPFFYNTNDVKLYGCTATNTWTELGAGAASTGFTNLTSGTNTGAAMVVGSGATLAATGSGTITATAIAVGGITGLGTGVGTFLATPSSANLAAALTNETGSGAAVFATSPTLVTPDLGTPSAAVLTSATGLPISTGVSGLGTGVATFLGTPSSANLAAALTNETGSGAAVFATSPTLVTPILGTPTSATLTNATGLPEGGLSLTDITTNNASTSKHGFLLKLDNNAAHFMNGQGAWTTPSGGGGTGCIPAGSATDVLVDDGAGGCTATGVTISSNNISTPGTMSTGVGGSVGGALGLGQGTATTAATGIAGFMAPASVTTPYYMILPAAPTTGFLLNTGTTDPSTISIVGSSGSGNVVRVTSATLVTPTLGAASATSINGLTITSSTGTFTLTNAKTFSVAKSITLDGTDSTTMTFPTTSATIARTDAAQTFTGTQTFSAFAGSPTTTTQSALDNSTKIATTAYVDTTNKRSRSLNFLFDGGGSAVTTSNTVAATVPFACTISAYNISADAGTATFKLWKVATGTAIPTSGNSINTSGIALATGTSIHSTTTSDFTTTAVAANDIVIGQLTAVATATWVSVGIQCDSN